MRLDKMIANSKKFSRKEIKKLAKDGGVSVNGKIESDMSRHIDPNADVVTVLGEQIRYKESLYIMMNKPQNVVSATEDNLHKTVIDLLGEAYQGFSLFPVGRLDIDTEGLLLITNDGELAHRLLSPKKHVEKEYFVVVSDDIKEEDIEKFKRGITLDDGYRTLPAKLLVSDTKNRAKVTIQEGKFHQIKRMFADCGLRVLYLKRVRMGPLILDDCLLPGGFRELSEDEERRIKNG